MTKEHAEEINEVAKEIHQLAVAKGWYGDHLADETETEFMARCCANIHGEVSELWEATRNNTLRQLCDKHEKMTLERVRPLYCIEEELADIVIRVFDAAGHLGIDIGRAIQDKHAFNATRPHRHGGKVA